MTQSYYQVFTTENGHYEFLRMPFQFKKSPSTFQRVMNNILLGIRKKTCLVYLDDIVVFYTSYKNVENA